MQNSCCDPCRGTCNIKTVDFVGETPGDPPDGQFSIISGTWQIGPSEELSGTAGRIEWDYPVGASSPLYEANQVAANTLVFDYYTDNQDVFSIGNFGENDYEVEFSIEPGGSAGTSTVALKDSSGNTLITANTDGDLGGWNTVLICWAESPRNSTDTVLVYRLHVTVNGTEAFGYYISVPNTGAGDPETALLPADIIIRTTTVATNIFFDDLAVSKPDATQANCPECEDDGTNDCGCYPHIETLDSRTVTISGATNSPNINGTYVCTYSGSCRWTGAEIYPADNESLQVVVVADIESGKRTWYLEFVFNDISGPLSFGGGPNPHHEEDDLANCDVTGTFAWTTSGVAETLTAVVT